ncbi:alpha/beta-hydrolase [Bimuria novae-zelandiae CBS 107.79]|uniref:Alpha/beta-hydrolase n=1 Tax=Bimuria novae-zelandiae CBS 107.79 TaxID=1447943 RepID=A0A6A5UQN4_9PLEO|nr:alpha/beta-hydrolase [Bimuria novae-zelandiae CBS 107.79]
MHLHHARYMATMPGRLPTKADFPSSATLTITSPPTSQQPTNVLILLHGLGDTHEAFTKLGTQLNLPDTACIAVRAPKPLPFGLDGFHWGDDMIFDQHTGEMDMDTGFKEATQVVLDKVIKEGLIAKCGYATRNIVLFGFAQGGMVALNVAASLDGELGGVVSIGGGLSLSAPLRPIDKKGRTPVLVCKASSGSKVTDGALKRLKDAFEFVEVKEWKRNGDGMMRNRDEMLPIMQFLARRLRSRRGVPEGSVELT